MNMMPQSKTYTREYILKEVCSMLSKIRQEEDIIYLGQVMEEKDYTMKRFLGWRKEYVRDEEISEGIEKIQEILETRVVLGAMRKEIHPTISTFHLKNNYKWSDKVEVSRDGPVPIPILPFDFKKRPL